MNNFGLSGMGLAGWALAIVLGAYLVLSKSVAPPTDAPALAQETGPIALTLEALPDTMSGYNLWLKTENFRFAPAHAGAEPAAGEGHAHLYVNGEKSRVYGNWVHLPDTMLARGENKIHVTLNQNSHADVTQDGAVVEAMLTLPGPDPVAVRGAWVRALVPMKPAAMYMRLSNNTDAPFTLIGGRSPDFGMVMVHESIEEDGVMKMVHRDGITVEPGKRATLREGGLHVMLMRPTRALGEGDEVTVTLQFDGADDLELVVPVSNLAPAGANHADHGHEMGHDMGGDTGGAMGHN